MRDTTSLLPLVARDIRLDIDGRTLLDVPVARIQNRQRNVVLGPNGAGKSLFLKICHVWCGQRPAVSSSPCRHARRNPPQAGDGVPEAGDAPPFGAGQLHTCARHGRLRLARTPPHGRRGDGAVRSLGAGGQSGPRVVGRRAAAACHRARRQPWPRTAVSRRADLVARSDRQPSDRGHARYPARARSDACPHHPRPRPRPSLRRCHPVLPQRTAPRTRASRPVLPRPQTDEAKAFLEHRLFW